MTSFSRRTRSKERETSMSPVQKIDKGFAKLKRHGYRIDCAVDMIFENCFLRFVSKIRFAIVPTVSNEERFCSNFIAICHLKTFISNA